MAFMTPVVRKNWDVWKGPAAAPTNRRSRSASNSPSRCEQFFHSDATGLSSSSSSRGRAIPNRQLVHPAGGVHHNGKRTIPLSVEIRNQQHLQRVMAYGSSLPSSFHSTSLDVTTANGDSRLSRSGRQPSPQLSSPDVTKADNDGKTISSSLQNDSSPNKTGSQSSLHKFHNRLVDRLRRSLRLGGEAEHGTSA